MNLNSPNKVKGTTVGGGALAGSTVSLALNLSLTAGNTVISRLEEPLFQ